MGRVKLALPEKFIYSTDIDIRIGDINYGGHLGNDSLLSLVHEARVRFLSKNGFSELDAGGPGIIMSDAVIVFKSEAFQGETATVKIALDDPNKFGCDILYLLTEKKSGREIARAKTGIVFFDYEKRKPARMSEAFKKLMETDL